MNEKKLDFFKDFLQAYFNLDVKYLELENLISEIKNTEPTEFTDQLLNEAKYIIKLNDWNYIHDFVLGNGFRNYEKDMLIEMILTIIRGLSE